MAEPWLTADRRSLGFCSKLALMRLPNVLEAGSHFSRMVLKFFIDSTTTWSKSVDCCSFGVAVQEQRKTLSVKGADVGRTLKPPVDPSILCSQRFSLRHIVGRSEGLQCYHMLAIDNGRHSLSLSSSDMCKDRARIKEWRIGGGDGEEDLLRSQCGRILDS